MDRVQNNCLKQCATSLSKNSELQNEYIYDQMLKLKVLRMEVVAAAVVVD